MEFPQPAINANISGGKGGELYFKYNLDHRSKHNLVLKKSLKMTI
jgi:hypothetical protein